MECEYNTAGPNDEPETCDRPVHVVFQKRVKIKGRTIIQKHPRCRRHASDTVKATAEEQGYTIHEV